MQVDDVGGQLLDYKWAIYGLMEAVYGQNVNNLGADGADARYWGLLETKWVL